ncbi:helix-turn-helix domain-containing protein [Nocardioides rotundus]|uniref:PucR family transcriptional regulator n=1 Tax=Nocardioides rotundus TaxID=1774216 RepID=UPI001CBE1B12|nr:helix-turn-helix domain-containing protein [Nocardioides rotundus]UAL28436.1 helix-turn-helix domain-containing protein [Nocardioides rotundus]
MLTNDPRRRRGVTLRSLAERAGLDLGDLGERADLVLVTGVRRPGEQPRPGDLVLAAPGADLEELAGTAAAVVTDEAVEDAPLPVLTASGAESEALASRLLGCLVDLQAGQMDREDELHRLMHNNVLTGGSVQDLCEELIGFLADVAMVTTSDGRILAAAGPHEQLDSVLAQDWFTDEHRLRVEREPLGLRAPGQDQDRALVGIKAGQLDQGRLLCVRTHGAIFTASDVHLMERAATVAALAITRDQAVAAVEDKYRAEFLRDLLGGRAGGQGDAVEHAAALGWRLDRPVVVVVAETDEDDEHSSRGHTELRQLQGRFAAAWLRAVAARDPVIPVAGYGREVVALLPARGDDEETLREVQALAKVVRGDGGGGRRTFSTGVSRVVESPADVPRGYAEALRSLAVGRQLGGTNAFAHFDRLGVFRLLSLIPDSADLDAFVTETLGPLADPAAPGRQESLTTLRVLLDHNLNVAETARELFVHYNTLRYRIGRLENQVGPFTTDPQLRLELALALRVLQVRGH